MVKKSNFGLQVSIEEMQKAFDREMASFDTVKANNRTIFTAASLLVSLLSALQILSARVDPAWLVAWRSGLIFTAVLYIVLIIICVYSLRPLDVYGPVKADWDTLMEAFYGKTDEEILLLRLNSIVDTIQVNKTMLRKSASVNRWASVLLICLVALLFSLALIPRI